MTSVHAGRRLCALLFAVSLLLRASLAGAQLADNPFSVAVGLQTSPEKASVVALNFTVPRGHYLYAEPLHVSSEAGVLTLTSQPPTKPKADPFSGEDVDIYDHDFELRYAVAREAVFPLAITVAYQGCSESLCFMPQTEIFRVSASGISIAVPSVSDVPSVVDTLLDGFRITGRDSGYKKPADFIAFLDRVEAGKGIVENPLRRMLASQGIPVLVFAILLAGLALNLTPCVLPMIPVNIAIIGAGTRAGSRSRGFALGSVYGLGIALVYGGLGLVVVLTGAQFGTLNASPGFNLAIAVLFFGLALAMFGLFNIDFSRFQSGGPSRNGGRGPFITAFLFGGVAALLAGACVAPVLIWVLVLSTEIYQRGAVAGLLLPFLLGLGMALPWPFAGAGLSFLPKPGAWMERIKIGFGVVILAASLYYGHLGVRLLKPSLAKVPETAGEGAFAWLSSLDEALVESRSTGKPVFVDVWATWCKSCKAMSRTTLQEPAVLDRLGAYVPLKFQAEAPKDPNTKRVLDALGVKGQPFYVVLQPE